MAIDPEINRLSAEVERLKAENEKHRDYQDKLIADNVVQGEEIKQFREALEEVAGYLHSIHQPMTGHGPPIALADCKMPICVKASEALKGEPSPSLTC